MPEIHVKDISLNFPMYGRHSASSRIGRQSDSSMTKQNPRLIVGAAGEVKGVKAIQDLSFNVLKGERVGLIGRNGSGKTSLLQILAGIYVPDRGSVEIKGKTTNVINVNLGMNLEATGNRNITLRGLAGGISRDEIERERASIAAFSELEEFLDMPIHTYSAGMRMRLNFSIATAFSPEILILDEWLSTGDSAFREKAKDRMKEFIGRAGILILASHSHSMLEEVCERTIWLESGRLIMDGPTAEVLVKYNEATSQHVNDNRVKQQQAQISVVPQPASRGTESKRVKINLPDTLDRTNPIVRAVRYLYLAINALSRPKI